ncbi:MAG TPA: glycosyl hydrolase, partial [Flavobacterium sp.]|nr:glycosyl hydrolase [Flavobacterium sp.]
MLKYGLLCIVIMSFSSYGQEIQKLHSKEKLIQVFTTAENTDLRLTPTNNLNFIPSQQPVES